jgi:hypothetical protein
MNPAKRMIAVLAATIAAAIAVPAGAGLPEPDEPKPLWHIDLRSQGLTHNSMGIFMFSSHDHPDSSRNRNAVSINSNGQVAVVFAAFQERNGDGYEPGTAKLHLLVYEAATGKQIGTKEWLAPKASEIVDNPAISTTFDGNFLLEYAGQLALYSPSLQFIRSAEIEAERLPLWYWTSPDGRYAFFSRKKDQINVLTIVDTETLQVLRSVNPGSSIVAASSRYLAVWRFPNQRDTTSRSLDVRSNNSEWEQIYSDDCPPKYRAGIGFLPTYSVGVGFLTDPVLIASSCNKLVIVDVEHKILFSQTFFKGQTMDSSAQSFSSSADGERFALAVDQPKRDPWWTGDPGTGPVPVRLLVYDTSISDRAIASFELHGNHPSDYDRLSFALSPDGASLVLIRDTNLEFVRLPLRQAH